MRSSDKKRKNICILAHAYQGQNIWEVADYIDDSFAFSQKAALHLSSRYGEEKCTQHGQAPGSNAFVLSVMGVIIAGEAKKDLTVKTL